MVQLVSIKFIKRINKVYKNPKGCKTYSTLIEAQVKHETKIKNEVSIQTDKTQTQKMYKPNIRASKLERNKAHRGTTPKLLQRYEAKNRALKIKKTIMPSHHTQSHCTQTKKNLFIKLRYTKSLMFH